MSIFPNSCTDTNYRIVTFLPAKERVVLSGVNHKAYEVLSNDPHFKNLFFHLYPCFNEGIGQLQYICENYPKNCWKINCCVLEQSDLSLANQSLKRSFLEEPFPARLYLKKSKCESQLKMICGERYEDSSSPIDQAWKASEETHEELDHLESEITISVDALKMDYGENSAEEMFNEIMSTNPNLDNPEELSAFDPHFIPLVHAVRKASELRSKFLDEFRIYQNLDMDRAGLVDKLSSIDSKLNLFNTPSTHDEELARLCTKNDSTLSYIFELAREVEQLSKELPELRDISDAIQVLLDNPQEASPTAFEKIHLLINSHSAKNEIWKTLYLRAGRGIIEARWAEIHFREFLPALASVIDDMIEGRENTEWTFHDT
jgi:hypothetical protein